jgi:phosphorylcholine metabolism protein LicD
MSIERDKMIKLLESKIETIVRNVINEKRGKSNVKKSKSTKKHNDLKQKNKKVNNKIGKDTVEKNQTYKRQYKAIEKELNKPEIDATSIFTKAGIIPNNKDDAARSHAFKKLHKDKTPSGTRNYKFDQSEVARIFNVLP